MLLLKIFFFIIASAYGAYMINKRNNLGKNYTFDKYTKVSILKEQLHIITNENSLFNEIENAKKYANSIIEELQNEFSDSEMLLTFNKIKVELTSAYIDNSLIKKLNHQLPT